MKENDFINECKKIGIEINDIILNNLKKYKDLLIEWNNKFNLTTITTEEGIYLKHFYDSLCIVASTDFNNKSICDFGTGAGFPGMVLAIVFNNSKVTLIESNNKKITFLQEVKKSLNLNNVEILHTRTEDYGKNNRELYDIVTCRAVSNLKIILELSTSLLKVNGLFIPLKSNVNDELNESLNIIDKLSYKLINKIDYTLPIENANRCILVFQKYKKTDLKYPRNYNLIKK